MYKNDCFTVIERPETMFKLYLQEAILVHRYNRTFNNKKEAYETLIFHQLKTGL